MKTISRLLFSALLLMFCFAGCGGSGGSGLDFNDVAGIPEGDAGGDALSGEFTTLIRYTSSDCTSVSDLDIPQADSTETLEVEVTQNAGAIEFKKIDVKLRGGVEFSGEFEAGGSGFSDAGGQSENIQRIVLISGNFDDPNTFSAEGDERLTGRVNSEDYDCSFSFELSGIRK